MKHNYLLLVTFCVSMLFLPMQASAIKKCQDSEGKWHYGDVSVDVCDNSDVTTLNNRGFVTDKLAAPKTDEELQSQEDLLAAQEAEKLRIQQEFDEQSRILSIYETEEDIDRQRDNQLSSVDGNITVHEAYLKNMDVRIQRYEQELAEETRKYRQHQLQTEIVAAKARVEKSTLELANLKEQRAGIVEKFKSEKETYLSLKNSK